MRYDAEESTTLSASTVYDTEYNSFSFYWVQAEASLLYFEAHNSWVPVPVACQNNKYSTTHMNSIIDNTI